MICPHCRQPVPEETLTAGRLIVNLHTRSVTLDGKPVRLQRREFDLLRCLFLNRGKTLTRTDIVADVWQQEFKGLTNIVDVYVKALRNKLGHSAIRTVTGIGYMLDTLNLEIPK